MSDMRSGDILIFEAGDDWIGKSIAKLTNSNVSHAAMCCTDATMVEMGLHGIAVSTCREATEGAKAYLLRLDPERDPAPLLAAAKRYVDQNTKYDFPDLILFAGLLIYRAVRPTPRWQKITDYILELACAEADKLLNKLISKGGEPVMVCSQLVYQIYQDCGAEYRIVLKNGLLQADLAPVPGTICLADLAQDEAAPDRSLAAAPSLPEAEVDPESLAQELYEALDEAEASVEEDLLDTGVLTGTLDKAARFLDLVESILERAGVELPVRSLFVAPSDLLEHAENLKAYGTAYIVRK